MGLFNIKMQDSRFYELAQEDAIITINKDYRTVMIEGFDEVFCYEQSEVEEILIDAGGVLPLYSKLGRGLFRHITVPKARRGRERTQRSVSNSSGCSTGDTSIDW
jgi:homoaconitate hydratase